MNFRGKQCGENTFCSCFFQGETSPRGTGILMRLTRLIKWKLWVRKKISIFFNHTSKLWMSTGGRVLTQKPCVSRYIKRYHIRPVKLPAHFYMTSHVSYWDIWSTTCFSATPSLVNNPSYTLLLVITVKSYWFPALDFGKVLTLICYEFPFSVELIYVLYCPKNNPLCNDGWE